MSDINAIEYEGVKNCYQEVKISNSWSKIRRKKDYCPLCKKQIVENETAYIMINNCKLFPNKVVHKNCVDNIGMIEATKRIKDSWDKELERRKQSNIW